jgi:hypothetical protein
VAIDLNVQLAQATLEMRDLPIKRVIVAGHGSGALYAKALGRSFDYGAVGFEGPAYGRSPVAAFLKPSPGHEASELVSVFSGSSIASDSEEGQTNVRTRFPGRFWKLPNPYETFCFMAAGCVTDSRFDECCRRSVGPEQYYDYFAEWNRRYLRDGL